MIEEKCEDKEEEKCTLVTNEQCETVTDEARSDKRFFRVFEHSVVRCVRMFQRRCARR